jgi:hypothetical protein
MHFKEYIKVIENFKKSSFCLEENFNWAKDIVLPDVDLGLPTIEKKSVISILNDKTNPIYMELKDKSKLFFTYEEFKRIQGKPEVGKTIYLKMQRHGGDNSKYPSRITMCKVVD